MTETIVSQSLAILFCAAAGWAAYQIAAAAILFFAVRLSKIGVNEIALSGGEICVDFKSLPLMRASFTVTLENLYTGEKTCVRFRRKQIAADGSVRMVLSDTECGVLRAEVSGVAASLFGAALCKKVGGEKSCRMLLPPSEISLPRSVVEKLAPSAPEGQPDSVREYARGDRLSDIHMKLSAKCGKYMVRERHDRRRAGRAEIAFCYEREFAAKNAALLSAAVRELLAQGVNCKVYFGGENFTVSSSEQVGELLLRVLSRHSGGAADADIVISGGEVSAR